MIKISIFTEGGKDFGFGHITRIKSIYDSFLEIGITPNIIINGDDSVKNILFESNYEMINWIIDKKFFYEVVNKSDIILVDSYLAGEEVYSYIVNKNKLGVYFDDTNRIKYPKGIVINGSIYAEYIDYPKDKEVIYLLGKKYIPVRKEFTRLKERIIRDDLKKILVTIGGSDMNNLLPKITYSLAETFPELIKNIIITPNFSNIEEIKKSLDKNSNLIFSPSVNEIKELMLDSDIAISAAGQTLYELSVTGTPTIMICSAENQKNNVEGWKELNLIPLGGTYREESLIPNILNKIKILSNKQFRQIISNGLGSSINSNGAKNIVYKVLETFHA